MHEAASDSYLFRCSRHQEKTMAHVSCPCGNSIWNGCDDEEWSYTFMARELLEDNPGSAFFDIEYGFPGRVIEMWKCDDCDNLMAFDEPVNRVTRYLQRCSISEAAQAVSDERGFLDGYVYSNLLYDHVERHFSGRDCSPYAVAKRELRYDGTLTPLVTPKVMDEEIFSHKNGRFRH